MLASQASFFSNCGGCAVANESVEIFHAAALPGAVWFQKQMRSEAFHDLQDCSSGTGDSCPSQLRRLLVSFHVYGAPPADGRSN